jgi:hypothetical protein
MPRFMVTIMELGERAQMSGGLRNRVLPVVSRRGQRIIRPRPKRRIFTLISESSHPHSITSVESVQGKNLICLLDIDVQGAEKVKASSLDALYLFVAPPSMEELESRLRGRGTEKEDAIQRRLSNARGELEYGLKPGNFDAVLVNNDLDKTLEKMVEKFRGWFPELLSGE